MQSTTQMRILNRPEFQMLVEHSNSTCLSLFLPTHRTGQDQKQDKIRLKNQLDGVEKSLDARDMPRSEVNELLEPIRELLADSWFWRQQSDGLAIFRSPDIFRHYCLPVGFEEQTLVGKHFLIRPLLTLLQAGGRYFVLKLSQDSASLLEATRDSIHQLPLPDIARTEVDGDDENLQFHSQRRGARAASDEAIFHGQGGADDRTKVDALNYFHRVNEAVTTLLQGEDAPLVLACVGYLAPIYEKANSYSNLLNVKVPGSPKMWRNDELRLQAWKLVESHFARRHREGVDAVQQAAAKGNAVTDIREAVVAARQGRIETLLLVDGERQWGRIDQELGTVQITNRNDGDVELLNHAAAQTLTHGGGVVVVAEYPDDSTAVAGLLRY